MERLCNQCQTEIIDDCQVNVESENLVLRLFKKVKGFSIMFRQKLKRLYAQIVVMWLSILTSLKNSRNKRLSEYKYK